MMLKRIATRILIHFIFNEDLPEKYLDIFFDWLKDAAGQVGVNPLDLKVEKIFPLQREMSIRVNGEDSHSGVLRSIMIYSDFFGKVRTIDEW